MNLETMSASSNTADDDVIKVVDLKRAMKIPKNGSKNEEHDIVVVVQRNNHKFGLKVDDILGNQKIVLKELGNEMNATPCVSGGTILGDGKVALILDTGAIVSREFQEAA